MNMLNLHPLAECLCQARFLANAEALGDFLVLFVLTNEFPMDAHQLQILTNLSGSQLSESLIRLKADGDIIETTTNSNSTYQLSQRGVARRRYLFIDFFHELRRVQEVLLEDLVILFRKHAEQGVRMIAIYPVGETAEVAVIALEQAGLKISAAVDDDPLKWGTSFHGIVVAAPAELKRAQLDAVILSTCVFEEKLRQELRHLKIDLPVISL